MRDDRKARNIDSRAKEKKELAKIRASTRSGRSKIRFGERDINRCIRTYGSRVTEVKCNERDGRLIPLADIPLFCRLTPARVGVEVVSGGARLDDPAGAGAELRVPDLQVVALTALLLLVDVVAGALTIVRLVSLLIVAVLKGGKKTDMNHRRKRMSARLTCSRTSTAKISPVPPH